MYFMEEKHPQTVTWKCKTLFIYFLWEIKRYFKLFLMSIPHVLGLVLDIGILNTTIPQTRKTSVWHKVDIVQRDLDVHKFGDRCMFLFKQNHRVNILCVYKLLFCFLHIRWYIYIWTEIKWFITTRT